jgi:predicted RNA-binding Zn-ribbon protein involved in translation (DUF1610 family)
MAKGRQGPRPSKITPLNMYICTKCGNLYDYNVTYEKESYNLPKYGKKKIGLCHRCRMGSEYEPKPGSLIYHMLLDMSENELEVTPWDYAKYNFSNRYAMQSSLSMLKSRNVLYAKKKGHTTAYKLMPEYVERLRNAKNQ